LIVTAITLFGLIAFGVAAFRLLIWSLYHEDFWIDLLKQQVAAMLGLPLSAVAALGLVLLLEAASGQIEFEVAGVKFKGASGPIAFWVLCFLRWLSQSN